MLVRVKSADFHGSKGLCERHDEHMYDRLVLFFGVGVGGGGIVVVSFTTFCCGKKRKTAFDLSRSK